MLGPAPRHTSTPSEGPEGGITLHDPTSSARAGRLSPASWLALAAEGLSAVGDGVVLVAGPLLASSLTHRPASIAAVAAAYEVPWLCFGVVGGAIADRVDRRRLAVASELLRAIAFAALAAIVATGHASLLALVVVGLFVGTAATTFSGVTHAALPDLLGTDDDAVLARANGYLASARTAGLLFVGPALGGVLYAVSESLPFLVDAASFGVSAGLVAVALRHLPRPVPTTGRGSLTGDVVDGVRYVAGHALLRLLTVAIAVLAAGEAAVGAILVVFATGHLGLDAEGFGLLYTAGAGAGVLGGVMVGRLRRHVGAGPLLVGAAVLASASYVILGLADTVGVAVVALAVESLVIVVGNASALAVRQRVVPSALRGRAGNALRSVVYGVRPLGALVAGAAAATYGAGTAIALTGAVQLAAFALVAAPLLRVLDPAVGPSPGVLDRAVKDS